jgi:hypothetical protein
MIRASRRQDTTRQNSLLEIEAEHGQAEGQNREVSQTNTAGKVGRQRQRQRQRQRETEISCSLRREESKTGPAADVMLMP